MPLVRAALRNTLTPGQFTVNERCTELIYNSMTPETKANLSGTSQFGITLGSGIIAGFAAAVLSHVIMTAGLVSSQFIMYGAIKNALGARPGIEIHKEDAA
ncbi:hypothetical protein IAU60_004368 [Kwoniella sp. DSM 27419]